MASLASLLKTLPTMETPTRRLPVQYQSRAADNLMANNWRTYLRVSAATLASGAAAILTTSTSAYATPLVPALTGDLDVRTHVNKPHDVLNSAHAITGDRAAAIQIAQFVEVDRMSSERTTKRGMGQVTSVTQLSDIQPTDWAFGALQSLVERYGCIAGYPDGSYRANRALTRYEFAAGLNACLDRINELIAAATVSNIRREDIVILQRLQEDFATELAQLGGRVDSLEARTGTLEANRFSASNRPQGAFSFGSNSRLLGEAIFALSDVFSGEGQTETVLQQRVRMVLLTTFTGEDLLFYRFASLGNSSLRNLAGGTREGILTSQFYGDTNNIDFSAFLEYIFPVGDKLQVHATANFGTPWLITANTLNPYLDSAGGGNGALSIFAEKNAIYRLSGGSGLGLNYRFSNALALTGGYYAEEPFNPSPGAGLFNGNYVAWGQLTWTPTRSLGFSFLYSNSYFKPGTFAFNDGGGVYGIGSFTGTGIMDDALAPFKVVANSYGGQFSWRINPKFVMSGWVGLTNVRALGQGDGEIWNYALTFALPDLGGEGNLGGLVVGAEPYLGHLEGVTVPSNDTSVHVEAFYKYQVTPGITITPGVIWITAPNQNRDNEDIVLGVVRTTFWF